MARALWKGAISFGLVNIPVELYPGRRAQGVQVLDARQARPVAGRLQALQQEDRQGSRVGRHRQGLRIREGPVRRAVRRGLPARQRQGHADDRHPGVRAGRRNPAAVLRDAVLPRAEPSAARRSTRCCAKRLRATGRVAVAQVVIRTTQHLAAVVPDGTRADARSRCATRTSCATRAASSCRRKDSRAPASRQGSRSRQAPGRRHDRALEAGGVQGHVSRRPDAPHQGKDQGRRDQGDHQAGDEGRRASRARRKSSISPRC